MKHKYELGDYVEYKVSSVEDGIGYTDEGFISSIEDRMQEDGDIATRYSIGPYIGSYRHTVCEEFIIGKREVPKNKDVIEYMKAKISINESKIDLINDENRVLRKKIAMLEKEAPK